MGVTPSEKINPLTAYRRMVSVTVILLLLGILGSKYFDVLPSMAAKGLEIEHPRLLNVLAMVRAQWLGVNRPQVLHLDWFAINNEAKPTSKIVITMSTGGWPLPDSHDNAGCQRLWWQLLGSDLATDELMAIYVDDANACKYQSVNGSLILYDLDSGTVSFLAGL